MLSTPRSDRSRNTCDVRFVLGAKQHAVDVGLAVNHVEVQRALRHEGAAATMSSSSVSFCSIAGWPAGYMPVSRRECDEPFEQCKRVER